MSGFIPATVGPIVDDQQMVFGRLTLNGAGACPLATRGGGAVTNIVLGTRITGGDHFTTSGGNVLSNVAPPLDASYVWTGCTATTAAGTSLPFTLTITTTASAYSTRSGTEISAALADIGVGGSVTVMIREGVTITPVANWLSNRAFTSTVTITGHDQSLSAVDGNLVPFIKGQVSIGNSDNITINNVEFYWDGQTQLFNPIIVISNSDSITISNSRIHSRHYDPATPIFYMSPPNASTYNNPYALTCDGGSNFAFLGNLVEDTFLGLSINAVATSVQVKNNLFRYLGFDAINIGFAAGNPDASVEIWQNVAHAFQLYSNPSTTYPHQDFIQILNSTTPADITGIDIRQNILFYDVGGEAVQGIFSNAGASNLFDIVNPLIVGNVILTQDVSHGISINAIDGGRIYGNVTVEAVPGGSANTANILLGELRSAGTINVRGNITTQTLGITEDGSGTYSSYANIATGNNGLCFPYADMFDGPTFAPQSRSEVLSKYATKAGGPGEIGGTAASSLCNPSSLAAPGNSMGAIGTGATFPTTIYSSAGSNIPAGMLDGTYWD